LVAVTNDRKFVIGDSGSITPGDELTGVVVIVISPHRAIIFPKISRATELMTAKGVTNQESTIIYTRVDNDYVDCMNSRIIESAFEYYIDPNL
jgi:hypothetical protein